MSFWEVWILIHGILVAILVVATIAGSNKVCRIALVAAVNMTALIWALIMWGPRI
jgi:hypothetical protein